MSSTDPRILLLDDETEVTSLYADILSGMFKIVRNSSPLQALDDVKMNPKGIDMVITDYMMPGMSGEEFVSELRKAGIQTPAILCSAKPELLQNPSLFSAVIQKPFEVETFMEKVMFVLEEAKKAKPAESSTQTSPGVSDDTISRVIKKAGIG